MLFNPVNDTTASVKCSLRPSVSIIIPAYNEEKNLGNVLVELHR